MNVENNINWYIEEWQDKIKIKLTEMKKGIKTSNNNWFQRSS